MSDTGLPAVSCRFFADAMLGGLAKWLRFVGIDTAYQADIDDGELVRLALLQQRIVLSRDRGLAHQQQPHRLYLVTACRTYPQLLEVCLAFELWRQFAPFSRCSRCNHLIRVADAATLRRYLPPGLVGFNTEGWYCSHCRQLYWRGSHVARMERGMVRLKQDLLARGAEAGALAKLVAHTMGNEQ